MSCLFNALNLALSLSRIPPATSKKTIKLGLTIRAFINFKTTTSSSQRLADLIQQLEEYGETNTSLILAKDSGSKNIMDLV